MTEQDIKNLVDDEELRARMARLDDEQLVANARRAAFGFGVRK